MTLEDFRRIPAHTKALASFLASPAGIALRDAMRASSPAAKLGANLASVGTAANLRIKAAVETQTAGSADNLLGTIGGYEQAVAMIFDLAPETIVPVQKTSKKAGNIDPEPQPRS